MCKYVRVLGENQTQRPPVPSSQTSSNIEQPADPSVEHICETCGQANSGRATCESRLADNFAINWSKALDACGLDRSVAWWISNSTAKGRFMMALRSITNYLIIRSNALASSAQIQVDKFNTMPKLQLFGYQSRDYHAGRLNCDPYCMHCQAASDISKEEAAQVKHLIVVANKRKRDSVKEKEVRWCRGSTLVQWSDVDCHLKPGRLAPRELAELGEGVRQLGKVHLDTWCKRLGIGLETGRNPE